jgi:predicted dehydrogenase
MSLRVGLVGLGMMGRNHARILASIEGVDFVGAVDPGGDRYRAMVNREVYDTIEDLIGRGIDAVVCAAPTKFHEAIAVNLAKAGVHTLIEKPVAQSVEGAHRIERAFSVSGARVSVGHIERYNPALVEMKRRLERAELGHVFSISTERISPFPLRVQDIGVIKDLATHDIDIVTWLTGERFASVFAATVHKMGRPTEDLLAAIGFLCNGLVVEMTVNWLTPMKRRTVTALGEKGALIADLLTADLTFHANADNVTEWDELVHLRGVTEGDMVRYSLKKREPLLVELEAFLAMALGDESAPIVPLSSGIHALEVAEALTTSARTSRRVDVVDTASR